MGVILGISVFLGILQSILFWDKNLGISVFIFVVACMAYLIYVLNKNKKIVNKKALGFLIPIILLSSTYFIFNNELFQTLNIIVILVLTAIMCVYLCKPRVKLPKFLYQILSVIMGALESIDDVFKCFKIPEEKKDNKLLKKAKKVGKSILIALPIIIIVLILLMSADEIFKQAFQNLFSVFDGIFTMYGMVMFILRAIIAIIVMLLIAGFLINLIKEKTMFNENEEETESKEIKVEETTIHIILTILNIIYLIFSVIQFTNLFSHLGNIQGFDYASYARQGFFQLMFVSVINFVILFVINMRKEQQEKMSYTKFMSLIMILFTIIIIVSAFYRMNLYQQIYGYTYLRIFVFFILGTELILTIPVMLYIIGKKIDLVKTSIIIVSSMYVILNFINIDKTIAKKNIDKYFENPQDSHFDFSYLTINTGTDAIPEIKKLLKAPDESIVERTKAYLQEQKNILSQKEMKWQEWNISKQTATVVLESEKFEKQETYKEHQGNEEYKEKYYE